MASATPDQPPTGVAAEERPTTSQHPPIVRFLLWLAYLWWKLVFGTLFLNYLIGGVQQVAQNGRDALGPYLTTWGLFAPWEQANPTRFLAVAGTLIVVALVGFLVEVEQRIAARREAAAAKAKLDAAHSLATAAKETATQAQDTAVAAHGAATVAHQTASAAHEAATSAHQTASEAKEHSAQVEQRVEALEHGQVASAVAGGPPQDDALLPAPETFVGRAGDLAWLEERLTTRTPEGRVSAITALGGMGGIGKSALAGQAIKELQMRKRFPDGLAVILANDQRDARALLRAVLQRFEPRINTALPEDAPFADLASAAHTLLDGKDALVVLDNLEPDDASIGWQARQVLDVLKSTGIALLVTARQEVPGLPPTATRSLDVLPLEEARDLFAEYYAGAPWADLSVEDQQSAEDILTTLGRHTLAMTLAATYAKTTRRPLATVAKELANPQRALTLEIPDVPKSVLSTFDLSYVDLPEGAQRLFRALGAAGTNEIGREATLALARALDVAEPEKAVDLLVARALARPSTFTGLPEGADSERLTLHPLLRDFAAYLLGSGPERERAEDALGEFYADYSNRGGFEWHPARAIDEQNITAALDTAHARGGRDRIVSDLCWGMAQFWRDRGKTREGLQRLPWGMEAAATVAKTSGERDDRIQEGRLLSVYGNFLQNTGNLSSAQRYYEQSLAISREVGDRRGEGVDLSNLGGVARLRGQLGEAQSYYERSLAILHEVGDRRGEGVVLNNLGGVAQDRGQLGEAQSYYEQALVIDHEVGNRQGEGVVLSNLGSVARLRGQLGEAQGYFERSLAIRREVGDRQGEGLDLANLGSVARLRGQLGEAQSYYEQSLAIDREVGDRRGEGVDLSNLGLVAQARGQLGEAQRYFERSLAILREVGDRQGEGATFAYLGNIVRDLQQFDQARSYYEQGRPLLADTDSNLYAQATEVLGQLILEQHLGTREEGCAMLAEAARLYDEMGVPGGDRVRETMRRLGCAS